MASYEDGDTLQQLGASLMKVIGESLKPGVWQ